MKIPDWVVIKVQANPDYSLDIIFDDGLKKNMMLVRFWINLFMQIYIILACF